MKNKDKIITFLLCGIVLTIYLIMNTYRFVDKNINKVYNVYLDGKKIGAISDKETLYELIDKKQQGIKDKYDVSNVYPPNGLEIVETYSYNTEISSIESIYNKIEELQDFTIYGYEIKVSKSSNHDEYSIYVLDKEVFNTAVQEFILAFIDEDDYNNYVNGNQKELDDIGINYKDMSILEDITIKEKYISTNEKIYKNSDELAQHLLFGFNYKEQSYTIKEGDTIESISEENTLNTQEFLIANPNYSSKDSLLKIGDKVNITLIDPVLAFQYTIYEMKEVEYAYEKTTVRDNTKPSDYTEITTPGVTGISIVTSHYNVVNGEPDSEAIIDNETTIREKVDQITTKGKKVETWGWETYDDSLTDWKWPTQDHYAVTSEFAPRWGKYHNGIDISGTGWGSKIYAANDGVVTEVVSSCADNGSYPNSCGRGYGNYVVINHGNNVYSIYAHLLNNVPVRAGQTVSAKQLIGYMGNSGQSKGTHLHFGVSNGNPFASGSFINPRKLYE